MDRNEGIFIPSVGYQKGSGYGGMDIGRKNSFILCTEQILLTLQRLGGNKASYTKFGRKILEGRESEGFISLFRVKTEGNEKGHQKMYLKLIANPNPSV